MEFIGKELHELTLNDKPKLDDDTSTKKNEIENEFTEINDPNEESTKGNKCRRHCMEVYIILKEIIFVFVLFSSSLMNFSYLNLHYTIFGLLTLSAIIRGTRRMIIFSQILFWIICITNILIIIFKIHITLFFLFPGLSEWYNELIISKEAILVDMGMKFLHDEYVIRNWLDTYLGDVLVLLSFFGFKIFSFNAASMKEDDVRTFLSKFYKKELVLFFTNIVLIAIFNSLNSSVLSMVYGTFLILGLLFWSFNKLRKILRILYFALIILSISHLIMYHFLSIPSRSETKYSDMVKQWLGIIKVSEKYNYNIDFLISAFINAISILSHDIMYESNEEEKEKIGAIPETEVNQNSCARIISKIKLWLLSPYFILHFERFLLLLWIYCYLNFWSIGLLLWVFYSLLIVKVGNLMRWLNYLLIWPILIISYNMFILANIPKFIIPQVSDHQKRIYAQYGLQIFDNFNGAFTLSFILIHINIFVFTFYSKMLNNYLKSQEAIHEDKRMIRLSKTVYPFANLNLGENLLNEKEEKVINPNVPVTEDKPESPEEKQVEFSDLLIKIGLINIDKLTLVLIYLIGIKVVNIFHLILVIIFLIQLIFPGWIKKIIFGILFTVEGILLFEYIWNFIAIHITMGKNAVDILTFFTQTTSNTGEIETEYLLLLILYSYYLQRQNYISKLYLKYDSKFYSLKNYIKRNYQSANLNKVVARLYFTFNGLYIWLIVSFLFCCIFLIEINGLFSLMLVIFFIIVYKFIYLRPDNNILSISWILIIYSGLTTMVVYFYQFCNLELVKPFFLKIAEALPPTLRDNFDLIGFSLVTASELPFHFLPYYGSNLLSVLMLYELKRIREIYVRDKHLMGFIKKRKRLFAYSTSEGSSTEIPKIPPMWKYYLFYSVKIFTKLYWMIIFYFIFILTISYQLSISLLLYMMIFILGYFLMFKKYINSICASEAQFQSQGTKMPFFYKLIKYSFSETKSHARAQKKYKIITFKILTAFTSLCMILTYLYALFDILIHKPSFLIYKNEYIVQMIQSCSYVFGVFHISSRPITSSIFTHLLLVLLIIGESYLILLAEYLSLKIDEFDRAIRLKTKMELQKQIEQVLAKRKPIRRLETLPIRRLSTYKIKDNIFLHEGDRNSLRSDMIEHHEDLGYKSDDSKLMVKKCTNYFRSSNHKELTITNEGTDSLSHPLIVNFLSVFKNIHSSKIPLILASPKSSKIKLDYYYAIKYILEEIITLFILISCISKLNIFSVFYLIMIVIVHIKGKNANTIFKISLTFAVLVLIQYALFVSNISSKTDPTPNAVMLDMLRRIFYIPWYENVSFLDKPLSFYFSLGVEKYQITQLAFDFVTIILCFFYLENFSYVIFQDSRINKSPLTMTYLMNKSNKTEILGRLAIEEYDQIKSCLDYNFDIKIPDYEYLKRMAKMETFNQSLEFLNNPMTSKILDLIKKKEKQSNIKKFLNMLKKWLFLSLHTISLTLIIILAMMNDGLISLIYLVFSFYYIYQSKQIALGKMCSLAKKIKSFLLKFIISHIIIVVLYQSPWNLYINENTLIKDIMDCLGISFIISDYNVFTKREIVMQTLELNAFIYFLSSIQILMYSSKDFQEYYASFLFENKVNTNISSVMNACLFNNSRIATMKRSMQSKESITKVLENLENYLAKWDDRLSAPQEKEAMNEFTQDMNRISQAHPDDESESSIQKDEPCESSCMDHVHKGNDFKEIVRKKIWENRLIQISLFLNRISTSYFFVAAEEKDELILAVLKGETHIPTIIEKKVENILTELNTEEDFATVTREKNEIENENDKKLEIKNDEISPQEKENSQESENKNTFFNTSELKKINPKFAEFLKKNKKVFQKKLFTKYLTKTFLIKYILLKIIQYFSVNFHFICYFFMVLNHIMNANLFSLTWPLSIFCYALLEYPRPKKIFWSYSLRYSIAILILKSVLQLDVLSFAIQGKGSKEFQWKDQWYIGIEIFPESYSSKFLGYIVWDCVVMMCVLIEQYILIRSGLWLYTEPEIEGIYSANDRIARVNTNEQEIIMNEYDELLKRGNATRKSIEKLEEENQKAPSESYEDRLFPKLRNKKPGKDLYIGYTLVQLLLIIFIIFFYTNLDQNKLYSPAGKIKINSFSGSMVLFAFFHVFLAVLDRIIYLKQNRPKLDLEFFYYNSLDGSKLSEREYNTELNDKPFIKDIYFKIYFQNEDRNYPLICKYVLHVLVVISSHIFIFWYLPFQGNINLHNFYYCHPPDPTSKIENSCNDFHFNGYLISFYVIYTFYFLLSGLQIQYGLKDIKKKSIFMRHDNSIYYYAFKCYNAIPFLYELKLLIDWTIIPTSLDLFKWIKFESIYDRLFMNRCYMKGDNKRKIGEQVTLFYKIIMGALGFLIVLIILLGPLILFSSLNPTNQMNNVMSTQLELSLSFVISNVFHNFTLLSNSQASSIKNLNKNQIWERLNLNTATVTKNFPEDQVQIITMPNVSDTNWVLTEPNIETIKQYLQSLNSTGQYITVYLTVTFGFTRPYPINSKPPSKSIMLEIYSPYHRNLSLTDAIMDNLNNCSSTAVSLKNFYRPAMHLTADIEPEIFYDTSIPSIDATLKLNCPTHSESKSYIDYSKTYFSLYLDKNSIIAEDDEYQTGLKFVTLSEKVSETFASYDVLGFYLTFIFVIGKYLRSFISGEEMRIIMTEMPEPGSILNLCEGIKIARYRQDFVKEEHLYYVLIDLMRSPEIIKSITKSSIRSLKEKALAEEEKRKKE